MRNISDEEIETFWRDGVVCLRSAVSREWVELVAQAMEDWLALPQRGDLAPAREGRGAEDARPGAPGAGGRPPTGRADRSPDASTPAPTPGDISMGYGASPASLPFP